MHASAHIRDASLRAAFAFGVAAMRAIGPVRASNFGGSLVSLVGPFLSTSKVADRNLRRALPQMDAPGRRATIAAVWRNIGSNVGEMPHLADLRETQSGPGWEIVGRENLPLGQAIFFSAHIGNWEMILPIAAQLGLWISGAYRRSSNPAAEAAIQGLRSAACGGSVSMFPKGTHGARAALLHLAGGGSLGLLIDQKMNDGIAVPFFGRAAMTAPAAAQFALRFNLPLVPVRVERIGPARLRMICEPPLVMAASGDRKADILALATLANASVERWVRADPGAWLWVHRRWPKDG